MHAHGSVLFIMALSCEAFGCDISQIAECP